MHLRLVRWLIIVLLVVTVVKLYLRVIQPPFGRMQVGDSIGEGEVAPQLLVHHNTILFLSPDRRLWAWGGMSPVHEGVLNTWTGFSKPSLVPIPIPHALNIQKVVAHSGIIFALLDDGSMRAFGNDQTNNGSGGQPFYQPFSETGFVDISAGMKHVVGLKEDGTIWAWGSNDWDQLGQGRSRDDGIPYPQKSTAPLRVGLDSDWVMVRTIYSETYGIKQDGSLWSWGNEPFSNPTPGNPNERPRKLTDRTGWKTLAPTYGGMVLCLHQDGFIGLYEPVVKRIGFWEEYEPMDDNGFGKLGKDTDWVDVIASGAHMLARKSDGSWWGMGNNALNQLALDPSVKVDSQFYETVQKWVKLSDAFDPWAMGLGGQNTLVLTRDGQLWNSGRILGIPDEPTFWRQFALKFNQWNQVVPELRLPAQQFPHHSGFHRIWAWPPKPEESFYLDGEQ